MEFSLPVLLLLATLLGSTCGVLWPGLLMPAYRAVGGLWLVATVVRLCGPEWLPDHTTFGTWLVIPDAGRTRVELQFVCDSLRAWLLGGAGGVLLVGPSFVGLLQPVPLEPRLQNDSTPGPPFLIERVLVAAALPLLLLVALLATDLVVVLLVWMLLDGLSIRFCHWSRLTDDNLKPSGAHIADSAIEQLPASGRLSSLRVVHLSEVLLLGGILLASSRYHSVTVDGILDGIMHDGRVDTAAVVSGLVVTLFTAAAVRCGALPWSIWLRPVVCGGGTASIWLLATAMLPGMSLAAWFAPLCRISGEDTPLFLSLCALSSVTLAGVATAASNRSVVFQVVGVISVMLAGVAIGTGQPRGLEIGLTLLLTQLPAVAVLSRSGSGHRSRLRIATARTAMVVLLSGLWGQNAVLSLLIDPSNPDVGTPGLHGRNGTLLIAWWLILASQTLCGFASGRILFGRRERSSLPGSPGSSAPQSSNGPWFELLLIIVVAALPTVVAVRTSAGLGMNWWDHGAVPQIGIATPAMLAGLLAAWMLHGPAAALSPPLARQFGSLILLNRDWWHTELLIERAVVRPVRFASRTLRTIDRGFFGAVRENTWQISPHRLAGLVRLVREEHPVYYSLSVLAMTVALLSSLV